MQSSFCLKKTKWLKKKTQKGVYLTAGVNNNNNSNNIIIITDRQLRRGRKMKILSS
jgi:hypothetical protein